VPYALAVSSAPQSLASDGSNILEVKMLDR
jgi:hypothetical protein